jgi:hypothetical protein
MLKGEEEGGKSCREEQRECSHAKRRRRGKGFMQGGLEEGGKSCREEQREGNHAGRIRRVRGVVQESSRGKGVMQ